MSIILCACLGSVQVADEVTGIVLADDLNVRLNPSPTAGVVAELRKGDRVNVRGFRPSTVRPRASLDPESRDEGHGRGGASGSNDHGFLEIDPPPGVVCYVAKKYVSPEGTVERPNVRMRSAPSLALSFIQTELPRGASVEIVGEQDEWWKVRPTRDCRAYVSTEFVELPDGALVPGAPAPDGVARGQHSAGASLLEEPRAPEAKFVGGKKLSMDLSSPEGRLLRAEKMAALEGRRGRRADLTGAFLLYSEIARSEDSPAADRALALQRLHGLGAAFDPRAVAKMLGCAARAGRDLDALARSVPGLSAVEGTVLKRKGEDEGEWTHGLKSGLDLKSEEFDLDALAGLRSRLWGRKAEAGLEVSWGTSP